MSNFIVVETTCCSREEADRIAKNLVENRLAGCAQIVGPITSTYRWQDKVETDEEFLCLIKSRAEHFAAIGIRIAELSSYDEPQIISLQVSEGSSGYLSWLGGQTIDGQP